MRARVVRIFFHVIVWLGVYFLPYLVAYGEINMITIFNEPGSIVHGVSTALLIAYAYFNHFFLIPKLYLHRRYFTYALAAFVCVLIVIWFPHVFDVFEKRPPLHKPPLIGMPPPPDGPPSDFISKMSYNIILFVIATFTSISIRQRQQLLEVQKEKLDAELSFLKAQINPHFLFNTLNSIYALSINKSDDTPKAITQLSELMRYILKDSEADTVALDKELNYITNYVALQKRRLGDTVQINYSAPSGIMNYRVAPLILTSFVENAFKHGVNPDQDSVIDISISLKENQLQLSAVNNKVTSINKDETMGIGLKNAASRLEHLYPEKHKLLIKDNEKTFSVNLILDLND